MKTKQMNFRVSDEFYELYENICKELNCSKTKYFIERAISQDFVYIKPGYEKENEAWKVITRIDHNMNQLARAMNQLVLFMKEKNNSAVIVIAGIVTSIITIMSLAITLFVIMDKKKKKKEEKDLEEYLDTSIQ